MVVVEQKVSQLGITMQSIEDRLYAHGERLDQMQNQSTQQLASINLAEASHQQVHLEVAELRRMVQTMPNGSGGSNDKNLVPEFGS